MVRKNDDTEEKKVTKTKKKAAVSSSKAKVSAKSKTTAKAAGKTAGKKGKTTAVKTVTVKKSVSSSKSRAASKKSSVSAKSKVLLDLIVSCLDKNKAENIVVISLEGKSSIADYMVVASGRSQKQVGALAEIVSKEVKSKYEKITVRIEGRSKSDWAVMDFGDIIVHIFHPEARNFYKIEEIWQD